MKGLLDTSPMTLVRALPATMRQPAKLTVEHLQSGTFQRSMSLLVAGTSIVSGLEVAYEHYKGSYSNPVMYTPVLLSGALTGAGLCGFFSRRLATTLLRYTSLVTLVDGVIGFGFHIRGIARKPGGWRLPITNIVMGPPIFAPLLFGTSAYLGVIASYLQREEDYGLRAQAIEAQLLKKPRLSFGDDIRMGRFQKHLCIVAAVGTFASGAESWYSHYKDNFKFRIQWSPLILTPIMIFACIGAIKNKKIANTLLPVASALLMLNGAVGTFYHMRGIARRSGGTKKPLYNILYGPPLFAPMLMAACGLLGALAYLMRRERD
jgi:hypothetical protein